MLSSALHQKMLVRSTIFVWTNIACCPHKHGCFGSVCFRRYADLTSFVGSSDICHFMQFAQSAVISLFIDPIDDLTVV